MTVFFENDPSNSSFWRSIILYGKNVASYKFALAKALIELKSKNKEFISLEELQKQKITDPVIQKCEDMVHKHALSPDSVHSMDDALGELTDLEESAYAQLNANDDLFGTRTEMTRLESFSSLLD